MGSTDDKYPQFLKFFFFLFALFHSSWHKVIRLISPKAYDLNISRLLF